MLKPTRFPIKTKGRELFVCILHHPNTSLDVADICKNLEKKGHAYILFWTINTNHYDTLKKGLLQNLDLVIYLNENSVQNTKYPIPEQSQPRWQTLFINKPDQNTVSGMISAHLRFFVGDNKYKTISPVQ